MRQFLHTAAGAVVACLLLTVNLFAQAFQTPQASMLPTHPPPGWIDGSKTPELIPDKDAFRLVFLWLQPPLASSPQATARQAMRLKKVGLSDSDKAVVQQVLMQFAFDYQQWVLSRTLPNAVQQSDALVQQTRDTLGQQLSADGNTKLAAFVQASKTHMAVKP